MRFLLGRLPVHLGGALGHLLDLFLRHGDRATVLLLVLVLSLVAPLRRGHGGGGGGATAGAGVESTAAAASARASTLRAAVVADPDEAVVDGRRFAEEDVVEEHGVGHAVHLDVADAAGEVGRRVPPDADRLDGELGAVAERPQDGVLCGEGIEAAEQDGCV